VIRWIMDMVVNVGACNGPAERRSRQLCEGQRRRAGRARIGVGLPRPLWLQLPGAGQPFTASKVIWLVAIVVGFTGGLILGAPRQIRVEIPSSTVLEQSHAAQFPDSAGSVVGSRATFRLSRPVEHIVRGIDAYGSGDFGASRDAGRRVHRGVDLVAEPGEVVRAPISGAVERIGVAYKGERELQFVEITDLSAGNKARVFYVSPSIMVGSKVKSGDILGTAQDLTKRYPNGMTNHVHLEFQMRDGTRINPLPVLSRDGQSQGFET